MQADTSLAADNPYHESHHKVARVYPLKYELSTDLEDVLASWVGPDVSLVACLPHPKNFKPDRSQNSPTHPHVHRMVRSPTAGCTTSKLIASRCAPSPLAVSQFSTSVFWLTLVLPRILPESVHPEAWANGLQGQDDRLTRRRYSIPRSILASNAHAPAYLLAYETIQGRRSQPQRNLSHQHIGMWKKSFLRLGRRRLNQESRKRNGR